MTRLLLLAAGRGSRLGSMTEDKPKCLNLFNEVPLIEHILKTAINYSGKLTSIHLLAGYKYSSLQYLGIDILINHNWQNSGPYGTLNIASEILKNEDCIVTYTDVVYDKKYLEACLNSNADIFVPSNLNFKSSWLNRKVNMLEDLETFRYFEDRITEIGLRPKSIDEIQGQFAGIFKITPNGWSKMSKVVPVESQPKIDLTGVFNILLKNDVIINTQQISGYWREFDTESDFL